MRSSPEESNPAIRPNLGDRPTYPDPDRLALVMIRAAARVLDAEGALHHISARWVAAHIRIRRAP